MVKEIDNDEHSPIVAARNWNRPRLEEMLKEFMSYFPHEAMVREFLHRDIDYVANDLFGESVRYRKMGGPWNCDSEAHKEEGFWGVNNCTHELHRGSAR